MKFYLVGNRFARGGTGLVIRTLESALCAVTFSSKDVFSLPNTSEDTVIAIQPLGVLSLFLNSLLLVNKRRLFFIFDTHPGSLRITKNLTYRLLAWAVLCRFGPARCIIPHGPLTAQPIFCKMTAIDWSIFVNSYCRVGASQFFSGQDLIYVGTNSRKKRFPYLLRFWKSLGPDVGLKILAYNTSSLENYPRVKLLECKNEIDVKSGLFVVTSALESYGLAFKELYRSGGKGIFIRDLDGFEEVSCPLVVNGLPKRGDYLFLSRLAEIADSKFVPNRHLRQLCVYLRCYENS